LQTSWRQLSPPWSMHWRYTWTWLARFWLNWDRRRRIARGAWLIIDRAFMVWFRWSIRWGCCCQESLTCGGDAWLASAREPMNTAKVCRWVSGWLVWGDRFKFPWPGATPRAHWCDWGSRARCPFIIWGVRCSGGGWHRIRFHSEACWAADYLASRGAVSWVLLLSVGSFNFYNSVGSGNFCDFCPEIVRGELVGQDGIFAEGL
jgi:hypothetical protein